MRAKIISFLDQKPQRFFWPLSGGFLYSFLGGCVVVPAVGFLGSVGAAGGLGLGVLTTCF